jgi:hypothetical protein
MLQNKLIIFVKNEKAGKVKTRLAKSIGDQEALKVYQKLVDYTHSELVSLKMNKEVWYSSYIEKDDVWENNRFNKKLQIGEDLGQRMEHAFKTAFENGAQKTVIIGSDNAEITSEIIEEAFSLLDETDFVIGPAKDGGYYLLGMKQFYSQVFEGVEWSTKKVFENTTRIIERLGRLFTSLRTLNDVDTKEDWLEVKDDFLKKSKDYV